MVNASRLKIWWNLVHGKGINVETPKGMRVKLYRLDNHHVRDIAKVCSFPKGPPMRSLSREEWKTHLALEFNIGTEQIFVVTVKPQTLTKKNLLKNTELNNWIEYFIRFRYDTSVVYGGVAYLLKCRKAQLLLAAVKQGIDPRVLALCEV